MRARYRRQAIVAVLAGRAIETIDIWMSTKRRRNRPSKEAEIRSRPAGDHLGAALRTESYVFAEGFRGHDPYDALLSPIFRLPLLRSLKIPRLAAQQALRRLPVNIRPLLGIPRGLNPVTLGLAVEAYAYLASADPKNAES